MSDHDPYDLDGIQHDADLQRAATALDHENDDRLFVWLMSGPKGRRVVWRLLGEARAFQSSFSGNAMVMAHNEGRRSVGLYMLDRIQRLCPEDYITMMQEQKRNDG